jgi:hypothetical protein
MTRSRGAVWLPFAAVAFLGHALAAHGQVKGDVNEDGRFDGGDAAVLGRYFAGAVAIDEILADVAPIVDGVGGDFALRSNDLVVMLRAAVGHDVDEDGLVTEGENALGTSPFLADTDGDGHIDPEDPHPLELDPPGVPKNQRVVDGPTGVTLTWTTPAGQTDMYIIHRYGSNGEYTFFVVTGDLESFVDTTAEPGVVYFYSIQPIHPTGLEGAVVNCDVTDPANPNPWLTGTIGPFANPHFTASASPGEVTLTWEQSTEPSVIGYRIYRSSVAVPLGSTAGLSLEQTVNGAGNTSAEITGLSTGKHYFRITAFSASTESLLASARQVVVDVP